MTMSTSMLRSAEEAAALVRTRDTAAVPLGPGQPATFFQALGEREPFEQLTVFNRSPIELP